MKFSAVVTEFDFQKLEYLFVDGEKCNNYYYGYLELAILGYTLFLLQGNRIQYSGGKNQFVVSPYHKGTSQSRYL